MPRLTFEALMAPGGLMDSGSRLTQTLIETPFKREQLRQGIREQEIGRAEQKQLRSDTIAREDKLIADRNKREDTLAGKKGRIDYYGAKASQADSRYAAAMKQAGDNFEKKMVAQIKARGGTKEQQDAMIEMMKQASSNVNAALNNPDLASKFTANPEFFATTYKQARDALMAQFGGMMLTTEGTLNATSIQDSGVDAQLIKEIEMAAQESIGAWENLRKEVGAVETRVEAREFMQRNGMGTETYGPPKEKKLGVPGAAPIAAPIVGQADAGAVDPNETDMARKLRLFKEKTAAEDALGSGGVIPPLPPTGKTPTAPPSEIPFEERTRTLSRQLQGQVPAIADATRQQADILAAAQRIMAGGRGTAGGERDKPYMGAVKALNTGAVPDPRIAEIVDAIAKQTNLSPDARAVYDAIVAKEFGAQNFEAAAAATVPGQPLDPAVFQGLGTSGGPTQNPNTWFTRENQLTHRNDVNMALIQAPLMGIARRANIIAASARTQTPIPDMVTSNPLAR